MSENFKVGDLVDIEASEGFVGGVFEVYYTFYDTVYVDCGDGDIRGFSAKSLRKVTPEADPRKINIHSVQIRYRRQEGITNLLAIFTVGNSHVQAAVETTALCSTSDTFKKRTGRVIAMKRACGILGVTMREIAEKM